MMSPFRVSPQETGSEQRRVTVSSDTRVFRRTTAGSFSAYVDPDSYAMAGKTITIGAANDVVSLNYNHGNHKFVPWEDEPSAQRENGIGYIMIADLPIG